MTHALRHGMTVRVSRTDVTDEFGSVASPVSLPIDLRHGYTVRVGANGPVLLAIPSGTGPFRFVDFVIPSGGFARVSVSASGAWSITQGTGTNYVARIDFLIPGGGAIGFSHDGTGFVQSVGSEVGAVSHFDFYDSDESVWRVSVDAQGQFQFSKQ